jgi:hypothetical protein
MKRIEYYLSANNPFDGKSVCLWRGEGRNHVKMARFQCDEAAKTFAKEFGFPLSDRLKKRIKAQ